MEKHKREKAGRLEEAVFWSMYLKKKVWSCEKK